MVYNGEVGTVFYESYNSFRTKNTGHELNSIKISVTNCVKFVSIERQGKCTTRCKQIKIGFYKTTGKYIGNVIWISLREAQHLLKCLQEFIQLSFQAYTEKNEWIINRESAWEEYMQVVDTNQPSHPLDFNPIDFSKTIVVKDTPIKASKINFKNFTTVWTKTLERHCIQ